MPLWLRLVILSLCMAVILLAWVFGYGVIHGNVVVSQEQGSAWIVLSGAAMLVMSLAVLSAVIWWWRS